MKNILKILAIVFLLMNYSCMAKQMVQTAKDVYQLKTNEQQFINKPLKELLKEIKPVIKNADASNEVGHQFFSFRSRTLDERKNNEGSYEDKVSYMFI